MCSQHGCRLSKCRLTHSIRCRLTVQSIHAQCAHAVLVITLISCGRLRNAATNLGCHSTAYARVHVRGSMRLTCHSIKPVVGSAVFLALCTLKLLYRSPEVQYLLILQNRCGTAPGCLSLVSSVSKHSSTSCRSCSASATASRASCAAGPSVRCGRQHEAKASQSAQEHLLAHCASTKHCLHVLEWTVWTQRWRRASLCCCQSREAP